MPTLGTKCCEGCGANLQKIEGLAHRGPAGRLWRSERVSALDGAASMLTRARISQDLAAGLLLLDSANRAVHAHAEAMRVLGYPKGPANINRISAGAQS